MSQALDFNNPSLAGFDSAPEGYDLSAFDTATGETTVPAGTYLCRVKCGELKETARGLPAYVLRFSVVAPTEHSGATVWNWSMLAGQTAINRAKKELATLGLKNLRQLQAPFPAEGEEVFCQCIVTVRDSEEYGPRNNVKRFTRCNPREGEAAASASLPNPFAVSLSETAE